MTYENTPPEHEGLACRCGSPALGDDYRSGTCSRCGKRIQASGRFSIPNPDFDVVSLKELSRTFLDQPADFSEAESRGWPGPYVEYTDADIEFLDKFTEIQQRYFPDFFDGFSHTEESD